MSQTASTTEAVAQEANPYVGPRPFERGDEPLFFGRKRETLELLSLVVSSRVVLLYAPSGAGKTSLINAGLIPALEQEGFEVLPVARIRPLLAEEPPSAVTNVYAFDVLSCWLENPAELTIGEFLASRDHPLDGEGFPAPRAVVLDQFEELFTSHPERWPEREPFLGQLAEAMDDDPLLRVVLAIREDYLAQLEAYAPLLPAGLRQRYRLDRLGREAATRSITRPLEKTARSFSSGVVEKLVDDLLRMRVDLGDGRSVEVEGEFVEPVQLQAVCQRLWSELPGNVTEITHEHLRAFGDVDDVLGQLYAEGVRAAVSRSGVGETRLRRWVETTLITAGGTRGTVYRAASSTAELPNEAIDELERCRVIRGEWRAGARWYELTHDRLIAPVQASNAAYFAAAAARRRRRLVVWAAVALPLLVAAIVAPLLALGGQSDTEAKMVAAQQALSQQFRRDLAPDDVFGGVGDQAMNGVTSLPGAGRAIAVGFAGPKGSRAATIWELDGRTWRRAPRVRRAGAFNAVAADGATVVAVGTAGPVANVLNQDASIWTRRDGRWIHTCCRSTTSARPHEGQSILGVVALQSGGFVAVGRDLNETDRNFDAAVWTSPDGLSWSRVPNVGRVFGTAGDFGQVMKAVTETPSGLIVAVGRDAASGAAWTSRDGRRWTRSASKDFSRRAATLELNGVVGFGSRIVAVGRQGNVQGNLNRAAVWISDDEARSWQQVPSPVFVGQGGGNRASSGQQMRGVAATPSLGLVAVGFDHPSGPEGFATAAVWTSLDGEVWTPVKPPSFAGAGNFGMNAVTSFSGGVMAVGNAPAPSNPQSFRQDAAVWRAVPRAG